jgi:hypothetical protein
MKMTPEDIAQLLAGTSIIFNECSVQFIFGPTMRDQEGEDDGPHNGIGFMADIASVDEEEYEEEEEFEDEDEPFEDGAAICTRTAPRRKARVRKSK